MLPPEKIALVKQLTDGLDKEQLVWLSGYLAGIQPPSTATNDLVKAPKISPSTILYGSQTGNSKIIAEQLYAAIKQQGLAVNIFSMADYKTARLKKEFFLFIIISTHGEGEAPDMAVNFFDFLHSKRVPQLSNVSYSVLALGDSSYEYFCKTGHDINNCLKTLGAIPLVEITECDVDFVREANKWQLSVVESLTKTTLLPIAPSATPSVFNREQPFVAPVLVNTLLNERHTCHIEFSLTESGVYYRPGDSLGVWPQNPTSLAKQAAELLDLAWSAFIEIDGETALVSEWLLQRLDIAQLTIKTLSEYQQICSPITLSTSEQRAYIVGRNIGHLLNDYPPPANSGVAVLTCFRRLAPRLYSLASSLLAREEEAHILVSNNTYTDANGCIQQGLCSAYLSSLQEGDTARIFIQSNDNFRLPDDNNAATIMIGPGTGIAPFRSFMEEREERGSKGKNWLFFGERRRRDDFYYQTEWQTWLQKGILTAMDVAFSRQRPEKIYVQHKMQQQAQQLWSWIENGAYLYLCGDSQRMAKDVHQTLCNIVQKNGVDGEKYLKNMKESGRYQQDVY